MMPTVLPSVKSKSLRVIAVCFMLASLSALTLVLCAGCQLTEPDPTGKPLTAEQWTEREERIRREAEAATRRALEEKDAETAKVTREEAARREAARAEAEARRKAFDAAVKRLEAETGIKVADLAAMYEQEQLLAESKLREAIAGFQDALAALDAKTAARINNNADVIKEASAQTEAAVKRIEERQARILGGIKLAEGAASTFGGPIGAAAVGLFGSAGIGGLLFGASKARKANRIEEASTRVVDAIDAAKLANPALAEAFKRNAKTISEWMGPAGVALVNQAQKS